MILRRSLSAALLGGCFVRVVFAQTALPVRVRGTIDSVDAQTRRHGWRRRRHSGPNTDPSLQGWGEKRCGAGECPDHHVWSGIPRDAGAGRTRHHYGNTEAGRLSDGTTRRRRTEWADTADVTATPPSARQEHFASDLRSRWSGPRGHGRGVPSTVIGMWHRRSAALRAACAGSPVAGSCSLH